MIVEVPIQTTVIKLFFSSQGYLNMYIIFILIYILYLVQALNKLAIINDVYEIIKFNIKLCVACCIIIIIVF